MSEKQKYQRQVMLPEVGEAGQDRLKTTRVLLVGMGGLGCPAAIYLSAVGVAQLTFLDHDCIDLSNLSRQILYEAKDVSQPKAIIARERLLHTGAQIRAITEALNPSNALDLVKAHDLVLDCSDNFRTRYLLSDACYLANKPLISAAISRFDAEITYLCEGDLPCYRCLFPSFTGAHKVKNCAEAGVLGSFVGVVGTMQAHEAVKAVLGLSKLKGRLLCYQGLDSEISQYTIQKDKNCPCCQSSREDLSPFQASDWPLPLPQDFCPIPQDLSSIDAGQLNAMLAQGNGLLIDVRDQLAFQKQHIPGAQHIPLSYLDNLPDTWKHRPIILYCQSGIRSQQALGVLTKLGFTQVKQLRGGINALR